MTWVPWTVRMLGPAPGWLGTAGYLGSVFPSQAQPFSERGRPGCLPRRLFLARRHLGFRISAAPWEVASSASLGAAISGWVLGLRIQAPYLLAGACREKGGVFPRGWVLRSGVSWPRLFDPPRPGLLRVFIRKRGPDLAVLRQEGPASEPGRAGEARRCRARYPCSWRWGLLTEPLVVSVFPLGVPTNTPPHPFCRP